MRFAAYTFMHFIMAVSAAPGLVLDVVGPSSTVDIDGLIINVILKNTGDESLKLLNDPRTVLSKAPTHTFIITSESGSPDFMGVSIKYAPAVAAALGEESDFTVLAPGESAKVSHSLAGVYNFTQCGKGIYTFTASNTFQYVDSSGKLQTIEASGNSNQFEISGKLVTSSARPLIAGLKKRVVTYRGCRPAEQGQITDAVIGSVNVVKSVNDYLSRISSGTPRYRTWFGAYNANRLRTVRSHFAAIDSDALQMQYDCVTCLTNPPPNITYRNTYAYVFPNRPGTIYLCGLFWGAPAAGSESKTGNIIHELSHFKGNGQTIDVPGAFDQADAKAVARNRPDTAIRTADNHQFFAENTPFLA